MHKIQNSVVAGIFYPQNPVELSAMLKNFLAAAYGKDRQIPKAIIAPHAGFIYSGPIVASAYACLGAATGKITDVVIIAPSHRYPFYGLAISNADIFMTPLGAIKVNKDAVNKISSLPQTAILDTAFAQEHALEVQLPFLQLLLKDFNLVPILAGEASVEEVAAVLELIWDEDKTLIVISSDLSHYHDYATAKKIDKKTTESILTLDYKAIFGEHACGYIGLRGLLKIALQKKLRAELVDLRNSGDTQGNKEQVVGYGAFHFYEQT